MSPISSYERVYTEAGRVAKIAETGAGARLERIIENMLAETRQQEDGPAEKL